VYKYQSATTAAYQEEEDQYEEEEQYGDSYTTKKPYAAAPKAPKSKRPALIIEILTYDSKKKSQY
jgi:hypothetical protein